MKHFDEDGNIRESNIIEPEKSQLDVLDDLLKDLDKKRFRQIRAPLSFLEDD